MKKIFLAIFLTILTFLTIRTTPVSASTSDFYFESAAFDYYLDKTEDGMSIMKVEESLTAVFPDIDQNHGIERYIPSYYRGVRILDSDDFTVTRNDAIEPYTTSVESGQIRLRIGSASTYVHGRQTYKITYTLKNVILQPDNSQYQELYWDTNGTDWAHNFGTVTATVHLSNNVKKTFRSKTSCYVGRQGAKGSDRCYVLKSNDNSTITFTSQDLSSYENLTLVLEFEANTFSIPTPTTNPILIVFAIAIGILFIISIFLWINLGNSVKEKRALAKDSTKPVQYVPPKDLTIAESGQLYLESAPSTQVATLMELAVKHKIELQKGEKKTLGGYHWTIHIKNIDDITTDQRIVLEIVNGGASVHNGDTIKVERHTSTSHLEKLGREYTTKTEGILRGKQLLEPEKHKNPASTPCIIACVFYCITSFIACVVGAEVLEGKDVYTQFEDYFYPAILVCGMTYIIIYSIVASKVNKYHKRTTKGIKISNYLDGLKEYMSLAEADRIKFLHSVKTADVSHEGIVRLYEKLLPYAILFRIEDSWMDELNKYYKMDDVNDPSWITGATYLSLSDFRSFNSNTSSYISSSTASQSSGSSGGGGGGFSGGGGGGGGGGGW